MALLPPVEVRKLRARMGGFALAASHDPRDYTAAARATFRDSFVERVDPDRLLPEAERLRRAEAARRLHFTRLALLSRRARATKTRGAVTNAAPRVSE